jgi:hypothetical protein
MSFFTLLQTQGTPSSQTITLNRVESTATVYNPTVSLQPSSTVALNLVGSTTQIFPPTVVQAGGVQTVTLNRVESSASIFALTVRQEQDVETQLGGFVVPREEKKRKPTKKRLTPKRLTTGPLTPAKVVEAVRVDELEEMQRRLSALASDVELQMLRDAEAQIESTVARLLKKQRDRDEQQAQKLLAMEQRAAATIQSLLEQAERRAREELLEVEELLDAMDALGY